MSVEGRWVGHYFEWSCPRCSSVMQALQGPATDDDAHCTRCNAYAMAMAMGPERLASRLLETRAERDELEQRERASLVKIGTLECRVRELESELAVWKGGSAA